MQTTYKNNVLFLLYLGINLSLKNEILIDKMQIADVSKRHCNY